MEEILDRALMELEILLQEGLDGVLVENFLDAPFYPGPVPSETVAAMAVTTRAIVQGSDVPVGVNVLRNDADAALAVASSADASFVRVNVHIGSMFTDQGLIQGEAHRTLRKRRTLGSEVVILADVLVKHASPPPGSSVEQAARDTWYRGLADGIILTGAETGAPVLPNEILKVREVLPREGRIWVGSGATPETAPELLADADGIIVGSALQSGGRAGGGVDRGRVRRFLDSLGR
jgi:membrane complex biogenesis BtpA family protein